MIIPSVDDISRISVIGGFLRTQGDMRLPAIGSWKPIARLDQPQPSLDKRHWVHLHVAGNLCKNSSLDGPLDGQNIDHNLFPLEHDGSLFPRIFARPYLVLCYLWSCCQGQGKSSLLMAILGHSAEPRSRSSAHVKFALVGKRGCKSLRNIIKRKTQNMIISLYHHLHVLTS